MHARRTRGTIRLIAGAGAIAALGLSAVALGQPASTSSAKVAPQSTGTATAPCPKGTGVIAGGFDSPSFTPGDGGAAAARFASQRTSAGLKTKAFNFGDAESEIRSIAYCSRLGALIRVASEKNFVAPNSAGVVIATCPRNSEVVAGGFANPGFTADGSRVLTLTSKRAGTRRWRVEGFTFGNDGDPNRDPIPGALVAYAYCLRDAPPIVTRQVRATAGALGKLSKLTASCPAGTRALSGGFDGNIKFGVGIKAAGAVISHRARHGTAWQIGALSISELSSKVTVYAYCVPA